MYCKKQNKKVVHDQVACNWLLFFRNSSANSTNRTVDHGRWSGSVNMSSISKLGRGFVRIVDDLIWKVLETQQRRLFPSLAHLDALPSKKYFSIGTSENGNRSTFFFFVCFSVLPPLVPLRIRLDGTDCCGPSPSTVGHWRSGELAASDPSNGDP